jgi:hypothetical protein
MKTRGNSLNHLAEKTPRWLRPSAFLFIRQANLVFGPFILVLPVLVITAVFGALSWSDLLTLPVFLATFVLVTSLAGGLAYSLVARPLRPLGTLGAYAAAFLGAGAYALAILQLMNLTGTLRRDPTFTVHGLAAWLGWSLLTLIGGVATGATLAADAKSQHHWRQGHAAT